MNRKQIICSIGLVFIVIIGLSVYTVTKSKMYSATVTLAFTPQSASAKVNGKSAKLGSVKVKPGGITVVVSKDGFATQTKQVRVQKGKNTYVGVILQPNRSDTKDWYTNHPDDAKALEGISSKDFINSSNNAETNLPLIKDLPYFERYFRIDYGQSQAHPNSTNQAIYITYYDPMGKQQALDWIQQQGYNPSQLEIIYSNQTNDNGGVSGE